MATANYAWDTPTVGSDTDTWGTKLNAVFDDIDTDLKAVSVVANAALTSAAIGVTVQAYDADLTAWASVNPSSYLTTAAAAAAYQPLAANLTSWAAIVPGTSASKDTATAAQLRANTADKVLETDTTWAAADTVALTDAATVAVDMSTFLNATVTLAGNRTLGQPSNTKNGQSGFIRIVQDGTGSRTLAYHADWKFVGGSDPTLSTAAGTTDILFFQVIAANFIYATLVNAVA